MPVDAPPQIATKTFAWQDCGPLKGQVLRCATLGFTYQVPFGWVDRTADMEAEAQPGVQEERPPGDSQQSPGNRKSPPPADGAKTLLAVFERPPGAPGQGINSAVVIAAESMADYPKIRTAADYFGPLAEIAEQRGLKMEGEPYSFFVGPKQLVRGDFHAGSGGKEVWQTSLVMLEKRHIVSFTFLGSREDDIDDLISALSFGRVTRLAPDSHK
jgi:hypothetical protein